MAGTKAIAGAFQRAKDRLSNNLPDKTYQAVEANKGWDDQWYNWDDLGGDDPGWGDIGK